MKKKLLGVLLSVFMLITLLPATVFAGTISTIGDVLATVEGGFPSTTTDVVPEDAWMTEDDKPAYIDKQGRLALCGATGLAVASSQNVSPSGDDYFYSAGWYKITFNMESGKLASITYFSENAGWTGYNGTYTPKAEKVTIADILPTNFPTSKTDGWVNSTNTNAATYVSSGNLYFNNGSPISMSLTETVKKDGNNYKYSNSPVYEVAFNMNQEKLVSITFEPGTMYSSYGGTYEFSYKKVSFVMADAEKTTVVKNIVDGKVEAPNAPAITDYDFKGWYYCDNTSTGDGHYIGMVKLDPDNVTDKNITVYAVYLLNHKYNGESGNIDFIKTNFDSNARRYSYDDGKTYGSNDVKSMPCIPGTYSVWINGRNYGTSFPEYFMKVGDAVIYEEYELTYSGSGSSTLTSATASGSIVEPGTEVSITATPASGYQLDYFLSDNLTKGTVSGKTLTFDMPHKSVNVTGQFNKVIDDISLSIALPKIGETSMAVPTVDSSLPYTLSVSEPYIFDVTESMSKQGAFASNHVYEATYILKAKEGYSFKYDGDITLNPSTVKTYKYSPSMTINGTSVSSFADSTDRDSHTKSGYYGGGEYGYKDRTTLFVTFNFTPECAHPSLKYVPIEYPNVMKSGVLAHYYCEDCDKYYLDEKAENEVSYLDLTIASLAEPNENYEITTGKEATIDVSKVTEALFISNAEFEGDSKFIGVKVDNSVVSESNYTAASGSTDVTLKVSYLKTLSNGTHTLIVISKDGYAKTTFTITGNSKPSPTPTPYIIPNTGVR